MKNIVQSMLKKEEKVSTHEIVAESSRKYRFQYLLALILISLFEIYFIARSIVKAINNGGFDNPVARIGYLVCYTSLLLFSIYSAFLLLYSIKKNEINRLLVVSIYAYVIFLLVWASFVSALDVLTGKSPIVFLTVMIGIAAISFIHPIVFYCIAGPLGGALVVLCVRGGINYVGGTGFLSNFIIFMLIAFFVSTRHYRQNCRDYLLMKKLEKQSQTDQLTGIKNRQALHQELPSIGYDFYFGILDFDNFKNINDVYGHDFGDDCLQKGANLLTQYFGEKVYRYGGDEFVVISSLAEEDLLRTGEKINKELSVFFPKATVSMSGGFYYPKSSEERYEDYLKNADEALYQVKGSRKGFFKVLGEEQLNFQNK